MHTPSSLFHSALRLVLGPQDYEGWKRDVWDAYWAREEAEATELEAQDRVNAEVICDLVRIDRSHAPVISDAMQWWPLVIGGVIAFAFGMLLVHERVAEQLKLANETPAERADRLALECPGCTITEGFIIDGRFIPARGWLTPEGTFVEDDTVVGIPMDWNLDLPLEAGTVPAIPDANGTVPMPSEWGPDFPVDPTE